MSQLPRAWCSCLICTGSSSGDPVVDDYVSAIRDNGWTVVNDGGDGRPSWSYTVGLWHLRSWPELVICGMDGAWRAWWLGRAIQAMEDEGWDGHASRDVQLRYIRLVNVDPGWGATRLLEHSFKFYRSVPRYRQMVWTDAHGLFPGDQGFDERLVEDQPDLHMPCLDHRPGVWPRLGLRRRR